MSMNVGPAKIALVEFDGRSVACNAFKTRLDLVKAVIDNGAIGGSGGYGSQGHVAALDEVAKQIAETRAMIIARSEEASESENTAL